MMLQIRPDGVAHFTPLRVAHNVPESLAHFVPVEVVHYAPVCSRLFADIATVESQVGSSKPKVGIIRESVLSIQKILEGAGGNVLGTLIVELGKMAMRL